MNIAMNSGKHHQTMNFAIAITVLFPVVQGASQTMSRSDACVVVWHPYNETSAPLLMQQPDVIRSKHRVPCRVLKEVPNPSHYEFGTMDPSVASSPRCILHRDPSLMIHSEFDIPLKDEEACHYFWASMSFDVDPLGPNIAKIGVTAPELDSSPDLAICRYNENGLFLGRMVLQGGLFGHCGYLSNKNEEVFVGGDYDVLSAIPRVVQEVAEQQDDNGNAQQRNNLVDQIRKRVHLYLSGEEKRLIASISGHSVEELLDDFKNTDIVSYNVLSRILSTDRFIHHDLLNKKGLSLLRALLAERMTLARRRSLGLDHHMDTVEWEQNGVLLKDFDYFTKEQNQQEFQDLLQMVAASKSVSVAEFKWVERNVTTVSNDPQREPHIDTFHSVVKMWVYERGVVTNDTGPLHYIRGSNRNTAGKLQWIYNVTLPPATEAIKEPSLRFHGDIVQLSSDMTDRLLRPVLPLDCYHRTLVVADTSGIHHRGNAAPGTVRKTMRVSSGNDGGLPRLNPYLWDGWERPETMYDDDKAECLEPAE